jgi:DNA-binding winged helix-turn-helix (wHTH) protein/TolB-like protein
LQSGHLYEFGDFRLDPAEHLLLRDGEPVSLTPKTFDLLVHLVEHRGRLVSKDQLLKALWPESFVEEANLTVSISALRKALGEKRGAPQYIDTVPKKGYRFVANVAQIERPPAPGPGDVSSSEERAHQAAAAAVSGDLAIPGLTQASEVEILKRDDGAEARPDELELRGPLPVPEHAKGLWNIRTLVIAGICVVILVAGWIALSRWRRSVTDSSSPKRLAVLPFQNLRHDPDTEFLGFSLADAIINRLGYVHELTIRPSYAIQKYRSDSPDLQHIAKALSVDTLLTGNYVREGENLRVSYQLIDIRNDRLMRQGTVDVKYQNLPSVQDDVSAQVINALALTLSPSETAQLRNERPIPPAAYEYYLRGVDLYSQNDFPLAIKMLEKSAELYPNYALTWAHLGRSYTASASFNFGGAELYRKAQAAYERALELEPTLLPARIYMANLLVDTGKPEQAMPFLRQVLQAHPNLAEAHWELGYVYRHAGMLEEALAECVRARELDPGVKLTTSAMNPYLYLGRYQEFLRSLPPAEDSGFVEFYKGFALYHLGQTEQAAEVMDHAYELDPRLLQTQVGKALADHIHHKDAEGLAILNAAENKIAQHAVGDAEATYKIAQAYSVLGDQASALGTFRRSVAGGFFPYQYFETDPLMANIRNHPDFAAIVQTARQRSLDFRKQFSNY